MRVGHHNIAGEIVDEVDIGPRGIGGTFSCLNAVQVHTVAPKIRSAHQHDDSGRPATRLRVGRAQTFALRRTQRAVVEIKMQIADRTALFVAYLALAGETTRVGGIALAARQGVRQSAERECRRTLEAVLRPLDRL